MKRVFGLLLWGTVSLAATACDPDPQAPLPDNPPTLTIAAPDDFYVARPSLRVTAACLDDRPSGCASLTVTVNDPGGALLATAQGNIDQTVSLAAYDGQSLALVFAGRDSAGQVTTIARRVFVESSSHLTEIASTPGMIMEVGPDRILFLDQSAGRNALTMRDRSTGSDIVVYDQAGHVPKHPYFTPVGAVFVEQSGPPSSSYVAHEWQAGGLTDLGTTSLLLAKGRYAVYRVAAGLIRRDVIAGTNDVISTDAAEAYYDVAANGDVAYWVNSPSGAVFRFRGGATTQLTSDALKNQNPITDGVSVVYMKNQQITTYDSSGEHVLTPGDASPRAPWRDYQVNNGWVAYTKRGLGGVLQLWRRSPAGDDVQVMYGIVDAIDALGPDGAIAVLNTNSGLTRRYLAVPGTAPLDISSPLGLGYFMNGELVIAIGRSLFQVSP